MLFFAAIILTLALSVSGGILLGSADLTLGTVLDVVKLKLFGIESAELKKSAVSIVWELRLPRVLLALAAGGGLAVAGAAMQSVTQNVLADPYILGASSGASAAVALAYLMGGSFCTSGAGISLFAFSGAILSLLLVYAVGMVGNAGSGSRLVLSGMAISVILSACTQLFITLAPDATTVRSYTAWTMGSLSGARWHNLAIPFFGSIVGFIFFALMARAYNLLSQGDETATSLGVNVNLLKKLTIIVVSFVTGVVVAAGGTIGFVGFIVPHIVRSIVGSDHRRVFRLSFVVGSLFLTWMDVLARTLFAPRELAVGIFTAFCGGPFFVWLLYRRNKYGKL